MLKNAPTLAIVAVHTEENEPPRILISNITNIYIHYLIPRHRAAVDARRRRRADALAEGCARLDLGLPSLHPSPDEFLVGRVFVTWTFLPDIWKVRSPWYRRQSQRSKLVGEPLTSCSRELRSQCYAYES